MCNLKLVNEAINLKTSGFFLFVEFAFLWFARHIHFHVNENSYCIFEKGFVNDIRMIGADAIILETFTGNRKLTKLVLNYGSLIV